MYIRRIGAWVAGMAGWALLSRTPSKLHAGVDKNRREERGKSSTKKEIGFITFIRARDGDFRFNVISARLLLGILREKRGGKKVDANIPLFCREGRKSKNDFISGSRKSEVENVYVSFVVRKKFEIIVQDIFGRRLVDNYLENFCTIENIM